MSKQPEQTRPFQFSLLFAMVSVVVLSFFAPALVSIVSRWSAPPSLTPAGPADVYFLLGCAGIVLGTLWFARYAWWGLSLWALLALPLGELGLFLPFGGATVNLGGGRPEGFQGFCGEGVPIPFMIWDGDDHPYPLAVIMNPIALILMGAVLYAIARVIAVQIRKSNGIQQ